MDGVKGKVLADWEGIFSSKEIKAKDEVGNGFKTKEEAVKAAIAHKGSEAIVKGKDEQFHVYETDIENFTKDKIEQTKDYPVSNIKKSSKADAVTPISFVTEDDYEYVSPEVHQNKLSGDHFNINKTNKEGPALFTMEKWPVGKDVTPEQEEKAIKNYASMIVQQFRHDNNRDPNPKELISEIVKHSDKLPYKSTNDLEGKMKIFTNAKTIFTEENSSSVVFKTGVGRCGDMANLHYKFAMEAANQLGIEKQMKNSLFIIGVEGKGGANVNHAALGFVDPPKTIKDIDSTELSSATVFDPWMRNSKAQDATSWGTEYCFDIVKHPLLMVRDILGPYTHGMKTTVTDDRYTISAFTPDYSLNRDFEYSLRK